MLYDLLYRTVLTHTDPERIHDVSVRAISLTSRIPVLRDAVRQLCRGFPDEYFRKVDAERAYPEAFVDAILG